MVAAERGQEEITGEIVELSAGIISGAVPAVASALGRKTPAWILQF
jgi:hypothetical protein